MLLHYTTIMKKYFAYLPLVIFLFIFSACKKKSDDYGGLKLSDYYPLETGKYITYQLDSIVYVGFGTSAETHSYQAKYVVDSLLTDNLGRPAYRVFRFLRVNDSAPWEPSGTFWSIDSKDAVEFVENNMRFVKLVTPLQNGTTWSGNEYIDTYSLNSEVKYLGGWEYVYDKLAEPATVGSFNLENTVTVNQRDEVVGIPDDPGAYSEVNFGQEQYALGIGLVYRKFFHSEYQPDTGGGNGYFADGSYGITLTMIDHN